MKIENIQLRDFRGIKNQEIELLSDLNVFVGINGSGKTTILDAIAICLSWLVNRIQRENISGKQILESSIKNGSQQSSISLTAKNDFSTFGWKLVKSAKGVPVEEKSQLTEVTELASIFQMQYQQNKKLPMIVYYSINRVAEGIVPTMKGKSNIYDLDIYDNALGSKANFQSFFEWFKLQDDIVNEQSNSRSKWMIQHKSWIKKKVLKIFNVFPHNEQNIGFDNFKEKLNKNDYILEEPTFLFREFMSVVEHLDFEYITENMIPEVLKDLNYFLYQMGKLLDTSRINKMNSDNFDISFFEEITSRICDLTKNKYKSTSFANASVLSFIWEMFSLSMVLISWWFSEKGKQNIEKIFHKYSPFNDNINVYNNTNKFVESIIENIQNETVKFKEVPYNQIRDLKFVTKTIENFIPEYSNIRIKRVPTPHMLVDKNNKTIRLEKLSDGEKNMIAMLGDIVRRLSMANSTMKNPLEGDGIVLIDEIDLHLHPNWQRKIIPRLTNTFPNCQFIVTTHSPQILSHVKAKNLFLLKDGKVIRPRESFGKNTDRILEDIFGTDARPLEIKEKLHNLFKIIESGEIDNAKEKIKELENIIEGAEPELVKANVLIKRKEILGK